MAKTKNNKVGSQGMWLVLTIILTVTTLVGVLVFSQRTSDVEDAMVDDSEAAAPYDVTISGSVWKQQTTRTHSITLRANALLLQGRVKEGHPENGCTNGTDTGVNANCDQNQRSESFDLKCDGNVIYSYRDRGPQYEEWTNVSRSINLAAGAHSCQVVHINTGTDSGSVDYELTFVVNPPTACTQVNLDFNKVGSGSPSDGQKLSTQFQSQYGISFKNGKYSNGSTCPSVYPVLAKQGNPRTGFQGYGSGVAADQPAPGQTWAPWFITDDGQVNNFACGMVMEFVKGKEPTGNFSMDVLDVHDGEKYQLRAYNASNSIFVRTNVSTGGNGTATRATLSLSQPATKIEIVPTVSTKGGWGMGYDNISFCAK